MVNSVPGAISAYQNAGKLTGDGSTVKAGSKDDSISTFAELVEGGIEKAIETQKTSEAATADYIMGKADINDVVMAVREAEMTLSTVSAIRDRIVSSLQEILRMPI